MIQMKLAIATISDTRTLADDESGLTLKELASSAGHKIVHHHICKDDRFQIRAFVSQMLVDDEIDVLVTSGGTGITGRDVTPEAVLPLLDKELTGFGELFRYLSFEEIGPSTLQSRAIAGVANGKLVFCLPGSPGACRTAWKGILEPQLNDATKPCNFAKMFPRLKEK